MIRERARSAGALLGHGVTTFPQLTEALARDYRVCPRVLPPELAAVVLERAVADAGVPPEFRDSRRGMLHELLGAVGELKAAYLAPADVRRIGESLAGEDGRRLSGLARVYEAYERRLESIGAVDRRGREWRVCDHVMAAADTGVRPASLADVDRIVFAELYDFSILQFLIATSLIRLVGDAELVTLAHPENVDATRFLDRTWNRFVGASEIADQVLPDFVVRTGRQGSLAAALRGVFTVERPPPAPPDGSIRLRVAPNRYREVEAAGREIRSRLERGEPAERIAIVARDLGVYAELIEDVCRRYRIPVHFRRGMPLLATGIAKLVLNLLRCVAEGFPRHRLEALLDSEYLRAGPPGLLRALRDSGFVAEHVRPLAECLAHARVRAEWAAPLQATTGLLATLDGSRSVPAHVAMLRRVLRTLHFRPVPGGDAPPRVARRDALAWAKLDETLTSLGSLTRALTVGRVPLAELVRLLVAALETQEVDDAGEPAGSVRALGVLDARGLDFDTVHLLGLDDGTFPAPRRESALLPDALKREVNRLAAGVLHEKLGAHAAGLPLGGLLRTAREAGLEDPFLFFLALSMPERELVLSYPAADERGNPTVRSPFVDEVDACVAGGLPVEHEAATRLVPSPVECREPAELVARAALDRWAPAPDAPPDRLAAALAAVLPDGAARLAAIDRRARIEERRGRYFLSRDRAAKEALADAFVGRLAGPLGALPARLDDRRWSPTSVETLAACGFKFFAGTVLGLRERDESDVDVLASEQGKLFHLALKEFLLAHETLPDDLAAARALVPPFLERIRATVSATIPPKHPEFFDVTWTRLAAALGELVDLEHRDQETRAAEGVRVTRRLEERVAMVLADPAGGPPLTLEGIPDRVEWHRRGDVAVRLVVVDYKTQRYAAGIAARLDPGKELGQTSFQIPMYLMGALATAPPGLAADVALEGRYVLLLVRGNKVFPREIPHALLDPGTADARIPERIRALAAAARSGRFDVDPNPCDEWCAFRGVCRYQPPPPEEDVDTDA